MREHARPEQSLTARELNVFEPYEGREVAFRAVPFADALDAVYGPGWRQDDELLFTCRDGYQPTVPVQRVLDHRAWLAFARADQPGFTIRKKESGRWQTIELGPYYLIWENLDDPTVLQEGDYGWPYQLVGVERVRAAERFPRMAPRSDDAAVTAGFRAFRIHCSRCHQVNGEGGGIGPELNATDAPVGLRDENWLRTWISDPSQIVATARMPALNRDLPDRDATIDAILAYLRHMAEVDATAGSASAPPGAS
ncbi:MAG: cytochrome c [Myxococcota bacterium]